MNNNLKNHILAWMYLNEIFMLKEERKAFGEMLDELPEWPEDGLTQEEIEKATGISMLSEEDLPITTAASIVEKWLYDKEKCGETATEKEIKRELKAKKKPARKHQSVKPTGAFVSTANDALKGKILFGVKKKPVSRREKIQILKEIGKLDRKLKQIKKFPDKKKPGKWQPDNY